LALRCSATQDERKFQADDFNPL